MARRKTPRPSPEERQRQIKARLAIDQALLEARREQDRAFARDIERRKLP